MTAAAEHPTQEELSAFIHGKLPEDSSARIEHHLAQCNICSETLASVADDTLIGLLADHGAARAERNEESGARPGDPARTAAHPGTGATDVPAELTHHPRYRVRRLLGHGGMGDVYLAEHRLMERAVAVKVMKRALMGRADAVERFQREVRAAARLKHENIVTAYDAEQAGDLHLLVMEYVDGRDLAGEVKERGALPLQEACEYIRQAALGLAHAHAHGMVHRDIKPQNLVLTARSNRLQAVREARDATIPPQVEPHGGEPRGPAEADYHERQIKILDFGLAQVIAFTAGDPQGTHQALPSLTDLQTILGTPDYIAPEQIDDAHGADHRADIYSLGATLYFLLTGRPPFAEGSVTDRIESHRNREPTDVRELRPEVPNELVQLIRRMMAKDPAHRYPSAEGVAHELEAYCGTKAESLHPGRRFRGIRKRSAVSLWGMPLYDIALGPDLQRSEMRGHARGIIAIGDVAIGVVAVGGLAVGGVTLGGCSIGALMAVGGFAAGGLAVGGAAVGLVAIGGAALGYFALGGGAAGEYILSSTQRDPEAVQFFESWIPGIQRWLGPRG